MPEFRPWNEFTAAYPQLAAFLRLNSDEQTARLHYEQVAKEKPKALACLLNITDAMMTIDLNGRSPLSYFKAINWDESMEQDRFLVMRMPR